MFEHEVAGSHAGVLARAHAVLDELTALELGSAGDGAVLALWRDLEPVRRRRAVIDHAVIQEIEARRLGVASGARSTLNLARQLLRVGAGEFLRATPLLAVIRAHPHRLRRGSGSWLTHMPP